MNWLLIVIIAHLIFALVYIIDKFMVSGIVLEPVVYAFYVGVLSLFVLALIPFGFALMPGIKILAALSAGLLFVIGLLFFYRAIKVSEISRVAPIFGATIPIFTLLLAYQFLGERLTQNELIAFVFLVVGGTIMARQARRAKSSLVKGIGNTLIASFLMAVSYVLSKYVYQGQVFINAFIWIRLGSVVGALFFLFKKGNRRIIFAKTKVLKLGTAVLVSFNKLISAAGFILLNYAIFLGSVSLVNALQGVQYFFLLIIAIFLSKKFPRILEEQISRRIVFQKVIAIIFICLGLFILTYV
jgi:drug/metabolite transporter (DMT)-like permease